MPKHLRTLTTALTLCLLAALLCSCKKNDPTSPGGTAVVGELSGSLVTFGSQYPHTFATAGTYNYKCANHPTCTSLQGTIVVLPLGSAIQSPVHGISQNGGTAATYTDPASCSSLSLTRDSVFVGDTVIWTNNSPFPHTVTSR
jgi:hypothetical protein